LPQAAEAFTAGARGFHRAKADRQAVNCPARDQPAQRIGTRHVLNQPPLDPQPVDILADHVPGADWLLWVMLEQHFDPMPSPQAEALAEGAGHDDVAAIIGAAEDARIAGKPAV